MENYLMNYDEITGEIKGFYLRNIHENIPSPNIEITPEKHSFYMQNNGKYKINISTLEDELLPMSEPMPYVPNEIEVLKLNQELMKKALDDLIFGGVL